MILEKRINAFVNLAEEIDRILKSNNPEFYRKIQDENNWFTQDNIQLSLRGIKRWLTSESLNKWAFNYNLENKLYKRVGVIMAGNIPLVGFHDLLSILISGHCALIKPSSQDSVLLKWILEKLANAESEFKSQIELVDRLNDADAFIGTGSDNSARYFKYYFGQKPNIIRQNRTSVAVLTGNESESDIQNLGKDIFSYYGLGCRNVSKLFVPSGYDFPKLLDNFQAFADIGDHHKYRNNYDYNKSIYLVNNEPHLDTGFMLLRQSDDLFSPISVVYFEQYDSQTCLDQRLTELRGKIQCVVGEKYLPFGKAQLPELWDYADGVDPLDFLTKLE